MAISGEEIDRIATRTADQVLDRIANPTPFSLQLVDDHDRRLLSELRSRQDKYLEDIPKQLHNRSMGLALEYDMDVLRELCKEYPDGGYIAEKYSRLGRELKDMRFFGSREEE